MVRPVFLLAALPAVTGQGNAPGIYNHARDQSLSYAVCAVDVAQAVYALGQAGTYIYDADNACDITQTDDQKAACSTTTSQVLYSALFVMSYLSSAASNCAKTLNVQAYCSADVTNLLADMAVVAAGGSHMKLTCDKLPVYDYWHPPPDYKTELQMKKHAEWINYLTTHQGALTAAHVAIWSGKDPKEETFGIGPGVVRRRLEEENGPAHLQLQAALEHAQEASVEAIHAMKGAGTHNADAVHEAIIRIQKARSDIDEHHKRGISKLPAPPMEQAGLMDDAKLRDLDGSMSSEEFTKRAFETAGLNHEVNNRKVLRAQCAFNIGQATLYIYQATVGILAAARDCGAEVLATKGNPGKMMCSVDISGLIGSFSFASAAIALTIAQCPTFQDAATAKEALCGFDISAAVAAVAGVATSGSQFALSCGGQGDTTHDWWKFQAQGGRRLEEQFSNTTAALNKLMRENFAHLLPLEETKPLHI